MSKDVTAAQQEMIDRTKECSRLTSEALELVRQGQKDAANDLMRKILKEEIRICLDYPEDLDLTVTNLLDTFEGCTERHGQKGTEYMLSTFPREDLVKMFQIMQDAYTNRREGILLNAPEALEKLEKALNSPLAKQLSVATISSSRHADRVVERRSQQKKETCVLL